MKCFFHKWSKWSKPAAVDMGLVDGKTGKVHAYVANKQWRRCERCEKVEERFISDLP